MAIKVVYVNKEQEKLWEEVERAAVKQERSVSWFVNTLIKEHLEKSRKAN